MTTNRIAITARFIRLGEAEPELELHLDGSVTNLDSMVTEILARSTAQLLDSTTAASRPASPALDLDAEWRLIDTRVRDHIRLLNQLEWSKQQPEIMNYLRARVMNSLECMIFLHPENLEIRAVLGLHLFRSVEANGGAAYHWHGNRLHGDAAQRALRVLQALADMDRDTACGQWALAMIPSVYRRGPLQEPGLSAEAAEAIRAHIADAVERMMETDFVDYKTFRRQLAESPYVPIRWAYYMKQYSWMWNRIWTDSLNFNVRECQPMQDKARLARILESFMELTTCTEAQTYGWRWVDSALSTLMKLADDGVVSRDRAQRAISKLTDSSDRLTAQRALTALFEYYLEKGEQERAREVGERLLFWADGDASSIGWVKVVRFLENAYTREGDALNAKSVRKARGLGFDFAGMRLAHDDWYQNLRRRILGPDHSDALAAWIELYAYAPQDDDTLSLFTTRFEKRRADFNWSVKPETPLADTPGVTGLMRKNLFFARQGDHLLAMGPSLHVDLTSGATTHHAGPLPGLLLNKMTFSDPWLWMTLKDDDNQGLWGYDIERRVWRHLTADAKALPSNDILCLASDAPALLFGYGGPQRGGLARLHPDGTCAPYDQPDAPHKGVEQIVTTATAIWIATIGELLVVDRATGAWQAAAQCTPDEGWILHETTNGILASINVHTVDGGKGPTTRVALFRFTLGKDGRVVKEEASANALNQHLLRDGRTDWVITPMPDPVLDPPLDWYNNLHLAAIDIHTGQVRTFGARHGLPSAFRDQLRDVQVYSNRIWFLTSDELYALPVSDLARLLDDADSTGEMDAP